MTDSQADLAPENQLTSILSKLPSAVRLGRATRSIIMQNLAISPGVIALLIVTSLTGIVRIGIAIFFHGGSTLAVAANALRLLGYRERHIMNIG